MVQNMTMLVKRSTRESVRSLFRPLNGVDLLQSAPPHLRHFIPQEARFRQTKAENEKELVVVQEELQQKKQNAGNTEVLLTADNLQQYVKKIEVERFTMF